MTDRLADVLGGVPAPAAYTLLAAALLIESNLLFGVFVPTLTLMVTAGALAGAGHLDLPVVVAVAAGSVVTADLIGYAVGSRLGGRLRTNRIGRMISAVAWARAESVMHRHGGRAVAVARFVPLLRTLVPHLAGATGVPYRRIAPYSVGAAVTWACVEAGGGYLAAHSIHWMSTPVMVAVLAVIGIGALVVAARRRRGVGDPAVTAPGRHGVHPPDHGTRASVAPAGTPPQV
ncbi:MULTISPECIES: DedA family protein [Micromonospora]|uniref:DedA family protein n=1 Tax=Micromonospora humidisoli TaxID=2807622 RepID=A0ABS2JIN1_9ACTN|nr:DedA family protein [Micromonospora humidisoli]MBM7086338.1 DedA family protein [Micromonospora humidisoli]